MNTYLVISDLEHVIIEAETEQKAQTEFLTTEGKVENIWINNESLRQGLVRLGYRTMDLTTINNIYLLKK